MNIKKLSVGLVILFLIIIGSIIFLCKPPNKGIDKRIESYKSVYQENNVIFLRKALDAYIENDSSKACILQSAVTKSDGKDYGIEKITSGLEAFDKSYYKSKFVVATYKDNKETEGSKDIQIIFRDKPDRIFYAWIGRNPQGGICLLGFNSRDDIDPAKLQETIKNTEPYFSNPDLAI
jgi:hypothetical protein